MKTIKILLPVLLFLVCVMSANSQERIKFRKGEISATVSGGIARGESYDYLVGASKGQFMTVTIMSVEDNAVFYIIDNSTYQYLYGATEEGTTRWEGVLPSTGDYKIVVGSNRGGAEYTLQVVIE
jgi:hypothetical protein